MSYRDFQNAIKAGALRTNRWEIEFNFPSGLGDTATATQASYLAKTADVPESIIGEIMLTWRGKDFPLPGDREINTYAMTFINVQDLKVHQAFINWSNAMANIKENTQLYGGDLSKLITNIKMHLLDAANKRIKTYVLEEAWPKEVSSIPMDMSAKDTVAEFSVTFRYLHIDMATK